MPEQHSSIIEFPRRNHIGRRKSIRPKMKQSTFIAARAGGSIAASLARCSTMKGLYRIRPTIGADKI
jgi:hypothetical protein